MRLTGVELGCWVDLDDPAEAVGLVGVLGGIKPRVKLMPAVFRPSSGPSAFVGAEVSPPLKQLMKFSSDVRYVPQGVIPLAQLLRVPSTERPCGSAAVFMSA